MTIYLGVDGGGSKTFALAADAEGRVIGFGQAGRGNHQTVGLDQALGEIDAACRQALGARTASHASFCLAGADLPPDFALLRPALDALGIAAQIDLRNDAWAAMRAGATRAWGGVVICGSGINAAARAPDGRELILPSLGRISGDWGGGSDIALAGMGAVARAWDGRGPPTALTDLALRLLGQPRYEALLEALYTERIERREINALAPLVFQAALDGDAVAQDIIVRAGSEIGHAAGVLLRRLGLQGEACEVVTGGSIFKGAGPLLLDAARLALHRLIPLAEFRRAGVEPVVGALLLAIELDHPAIPPQMLARMRASLPEQLVLQG